MNSAPMLQMSNASHRTPNERHIAPAASIGSATPATLWGRQVVQQHDLAVLESRDKALLHIGEKHRPVDGSFEHKRCGHAALPPTKVIAFQCPCGASPTSRSPRGARTRSRTIAVFVQVSSMTTSRAVSNMLCSRIQCRHVRTLLLRSVQIFLKLMLWRAKNRHTALRLPAIRRLRISDTAADDADGADTNLGPRRFDPMGPDFAPAARMIGHAARPFVEYRAARAYRVGPAGSCNTVNQSSEVRGPRCH